MPKAQKSVKNAGFHGIGATISTRRQSLCLPYIRMRMRMRMRMWDFY